MAAPTSHWYAGTDNDRRAELDAGARRAAERAPQFVHGHAAGERCTGWCHEIHIRYEVSDLVAEPEPEPAAALAECVDALLAAKKPASCPPDFAAALEALRQLRQAANG